MKFQEKITNYINRIITKRRFFKFSIVGLSGIAVNQGLLCILTEHVRLFYMISSIIAIEISIVTNYFLNDLWTWRDRSKQIWIKRITKYHSVSLASLLVNWAVLVSLTEFLRVHYLKSNLIGIACGMLINYILNDIWTFREKRLI
jgi:dolichol-phosphate mannosyltransferase